MDNIFEGIAVAREEAGTLLLEELGINEENINEYVMESDVRDDGSELIKIYRKELVGAKLLTYTVRAEDGAELLTDKVRHDKAN